MTPRNTCDNPSNNLELMHNCAFIKNGEAYYRDFSREFSIRKLTRLLLGKYAGYNDDNIPSSNDELDELLYDNGYYEPEEDIEGFISAFYSLVVGAAENRELLKLYETVGLPVTSNPNVLQQCIDTYGADKQVDQAIEEMSELIKALLKYRRKECQLSGKNVNPTPDNLGKLRADILEETADVIIMLMQIIMIYGGRDEVQKVIDQKIERQKTRLEGSSE